MTVLTALRMQETQLVHALTAQAPDADDSDGWIVPQDLDCSLPWADVDLNTNASHHLDDPTARDEEGEPLWHTMPAGLESLSYAPHAFGASKAKNDPDTLSWEQAMAHPLREKFLESARI